MYYINCVISVCLITIGKCERMTGCNRANDSVHLCMNIGESKRCYFRFFSIVFSLVYHKWARRKTIQRNWCLNSFERYCGDGGEHAARISGVMFRQISRNQFNLFWITIKERWRKLVFKRHSMVWVGTIKVMRRISRKGWYRSERVWQIQDVCLQSGVRGEGWIYHHVRTSSLKCHQKS